MSGAMKFYRKPLSPLKLLCEAARFGFVLVAILNMFDVFPARFRITPMILIGTILVISGLNRVDSKRSAGDEEPRTPVKGMGG